MASALGFTRTRTERLVIVTHAVRRVDALLVGVVLAGHVARGDTLRDGQNVAVQPGLLVTLDEGGDPARGGGVAAGEVAQVLGAVAVRSVLLAGVDTGSVRHQGFL